MEIRNVPLDLSNEDLENYLAEIKRFFGTS
jgi:hypothetical protein